MDTHSPAVLIVLACLMTTPGQLAQEPRGEPQPPAVQAPTFRSGVDLIRLDVIVVGADGTPVPDLVSDDFEVLVDGKRRPVVTSRFLSLASSKREAPSGTSLAASRDYSTNDAGVTGRLLVLAIDHESLPSGAGRPLMLAASELLQQLGPADRVALVTVPQPGQRIEFTSDIEEIKRSLTRVVGRRQSRFRTVRISFDEAQAIERGEDRTYAELLERECAHRYDETCPDQVRSEARDVLDENRERIQVTLSALSGVADSLASIDGPKTIVLLSAGIGYENRVLARFKELARRAADARLTIYAVQVDTFSFDASERASSAAFMGDVVSGRRGLETIVGLTGGAFFQGVARGTGPFARIGREAGGLYVLGVEPPDGTLPTSELDLKVRVRRPGVTVRSPQQVVPPTPLTRWPDSRRALGYTLRQPRQASELPVKVTTYTVRGQDDLRLKTVIAAELALPLGVSADLAWGFEVLDKGRVIADAFDHGLPRGSSATDDGVMLVTAVNLPAGTYALKFAVIDGAGRRGSVEHPISVGLRMTHAGMGEGASPERLYFSDLLVGTEVDGRFQPRLQFTAGASVVSALLELYGGPESRLDGAVVEFEVRGLDGATRSATRVTPTTAEGSYRKVAIAAIPVSGLSPGSYDLLGKVLLDGRALGMVRRQVTVTSASAPQANQ